MAADFTCCAPELTPWIYAFSKVPFGLYSDKHKNNSFSKILHVLEILKNKYFLRSFRSSSLGILNSLCQSFEFFHMYVKRFCATGASYFFSISLIVLFHWFHSTRISSIYPIRLTHSRFLPLNIFHVTSSTLTEDTFEMSALFSVVILLTFPKKKRKKWERFPQGEVREATFSRRFSFIRYPAKDAILDHRGIE